jgi:DNA replication ATP-dependent helicase Dna2
MQRHAFTSECATLLYDELADTLFDTALTAQSKIVRLRQLLDDMLWQATANEPQLFSDTYSRLLYTVDKYRLAEYVTRELHALRTLTKRLHKHISDKRLHSAARALAMGVFALSEVRAPDRLRDVLKAASPLVPERPRSIGDDELPFVRLRVLEVVETAESATPNVQHRTLRCLDESGAVFMLRVVEPWLSVCHALWKFATLHAFHLKHVPAQSGLQAGDDAALEDRAYYTTTAQSLLVVEPDYLVDVTEIAECFQNEGINPRIALLKKFVRSRTSHAMVLGNIINACFDALIVQPAVAFEQALQDALLQKPTSVLPLLADNPQIVELLAEQAQQHFTTLKQALADLRVPSEGIAASIEPSFLSPEYGLQGRLDLMLEYDDDARRKTVVELKSGAPSKPQYQLAWASHTAQVAAYNLLLDSCFGEGAVARSGDSMICYSQDPQTPLRNIPNDVRSKQQVLAVRNRLVAIEHAFCERQFGELRALSAERIGIVPPYSQQTVLAFQTAYQNASDLERAYFRTFAAFVSREHWSARLGAGSVTGSATNVNGFATLWRDSLEQKEAAFAVLSHLRLNVQESDFTRMHLVFERTERTPEVANFRTGDVVIVYALGASSTNDDDTIPQKHPQTSPFKQQLLKGSIRQLSDARLVISLRNKQIQGISFSAEAAWCVEHDFFGNEFSSQTQSLFDFLSSDRSKRLLWLGLRAPETDDAADWQRRVPRYADLTDEQHERLCQALAAREYFLLQGPPGTGKTSRMIRSLAQYCFEHTDEHLLLLAFTNRAADEICAALLQSGRNGDFIRLGGKDSSVHQEHILFEQSVGKSVHDIATMLTNTRLIVSTISTLLKTPEILAVKRFARVIVDEASQVLEPQIIGLLAQCERVVLVGDEKQLPAVVVQPESGVFVSNAELNAVGIKDLRVSLFERLITRCKAQGWSHAYGMISRQGRMHSAIAAFPNVRFYGGALQPLAAWQTDTTACTPLVETTLVETPLVEDVGKKTRWSERLLFLRSEREQHSNVHLSEAKRVAWLVEHIWLHHERHQIPFTAQSVGVITPFRAQIAAISRAFAERPLLQQHHVRQLVTIDTVERYQGSERDIVIISFAVNHAPQLRALQSLSPDGSIDRKLNVALTRARERLIVLGCEEVLSQSPHLQALLQWIKNTTVLDTATNKQV